MLIDFNSFLQLPIFGIFGESKRIRNAQPNQDGLSLMNDIRYSIHIIRVEPMFRYLLPINRPNSSYGTLN